MGASQRTKGQRGERDFLKALGDELGESLSRNLDQTREGGADCLCVRGWAIEVKRQERLSRPTWWRQAIEQADRHGVQPMLAYRRNREPWRVWVHKVGTQYVETDVAGAANAIREKWMMWP
jgi:hypothetical protein